MSQEENNLLDREASLLRHVAFISTMMGGTPGRPLTAS
jgi:hypothetical protein